jgi:hypothetical protein
MRKRVLPQTPLRFIFQPELSAAPIRGIRMQDIIGDSTVLANGGAVTASELTIDFDTLRDALHQK